MTKIPKVIHYCWFGGKPLPPLTEECIASWKKHMPNYEIIEWNESNFDINSNLYVKQAYDSKKYAFVSDYVRLHALFSHGGIYFDTDVEVLKPFDQFLTEDGFFGFESKEHIASAIMGSRKESRFIGDLLELYRDRTFILDNGKYDLTTNVLINTEIFKKQGLKLNGKKQIISNSTFYPQSYFCPNNMRILFSFKPNGSFSIHHYEGSWHRDKPNNNSFPYRLMHFIGGKLRNAMGYNNYVKFNKFIRKLLK